MLSREECSEQLAEEKEEKEKTTSSLLLLPSRTPDQTRDALLLSRDQKRELSYPFINYNFFISQFRSFRKFFLI